MCTWVVFKNIEALPGLLFVVLKSAFTGHAPVAGFVGSTALAAIHFGVARAVYSGDIGIGYDSMVQSETKSKNPEHQARLAIFGSLTDLIICTCTVLVVLLTGVWKDPSMTELSQYIIKSLSILSLHGSVYEHSIFYSWLYDYNCVFYSGG